MNEINTQFKLAFNRIRTSGIKGPEIDELENRVADYLMKCHDASQPALMLQFDVNRIIRDLRKYDNLSNHGYLSLAHQEFVLNQKKEKVPQALTAELENPPGLTHNILGMAKIQEESEIREDVIEENTDMGTISGQQNYIVPNKTAVVESEEPEKKPELTCESIYDVIQNLKIDDVKFLYEDTDFVDGKLAKKSSTANLTRKSRKLAFKMIAESGSTEDVSRLATKIATKIKLIEDTLNEVNLMPESDIGKEARFGLSGEVLHRNFKDVVEHGTARIKKPESVASMGSIKGVHLKLLSHSDEPNEGHLIAHDDEGNVHHYLKLSKPEGFHDDVMVSKLAIKNHDIKSPIKMHDIYSHLINHGVVMMSDSSQSHGGLATWKKLAETPGINVHGWNTRTDKPVNTDKFLGDISDTHKDEIDDIDNNPESKANDDILRNVRLIAHKKGLNEEVLNEIHMLNYEKGQKFEDSMFYGHSGINDARDYLGTFSKEEDMGKLGHMNVSKFEDPYSKTHKGRIITHDDTGKIHHVLTYERPHEESPNTLKIKSITANDKGDKTIGAHELYHHMLDRGHMIQSDDSQTEGGMHVWKRLSEKPGVNIHAWDTSTDSAVDTADPIGHARNNPHVILLAHK